MKSLGYGRSLRVIKNAMFDDLVFLGPVPLLLCINETPSDLFTVEESPMLIRLTSNVDTNLHYEVN